MWFAPIHCIVISKSMRVCRMGLFATFGRSLALSAAKRDIPLPAGRARLNFWQFVCSHIGLHLTYASKSNEKNTWRRECICFVYHVVGALVLLHDLSIRAHFSLCLHIYDTFESQTTCITAFSRNKHRIYSLSLDSSHLTLCHMYKQKIFFFLTFSTLSTHHHAYHFFRNLAYIASASTMDKQIDDKFRCAYIQLIKPCGPSNGSLATELSSSGREPHRSLTQFF